MDTICFFICDNLYDAEVKARELEEQGYKTRVQETWSGKRRTSPKVYNVLGTPKTNEWNPRSPDPEKRGRKGRKALQALFQKEV